MKFLPLLLLPFSLLSSGCLIGERIQREELVGRWGNDEFPGLKLREDSTFTYTWHDGLGTRETKGTWAVQSKRLILTSEYRRAPQNSPPFTLLEQKGIPGDSLTIRIVDQDSVLISYGTFVLLKGDSITHGALGNSQGLARLPASDATTLEIRCHACER
ncbi:MAG: hypothetical protein AAF399_24730, partial [Bacteroidota bacterium]